MAYKERERIIVTVALSSIVLLAATFTIGNVYAFVATLSASTISRGTPFIRVTATGFAGEGFVRVDGTAYNALYANSLYACVDPLFIQKSRLYHQTAASRWRFPPRLSRS